jgi:uncharacterized protein YecT (DUF1311 family)
LVRAFVIAAYASVLFGIVGAVQAQDAPVQRQIAPERFAPSPRGPEAAKAPIVMPSRERPVGACDPSTHDWLACLDGTATLSDRAVDDAVAALTAGLEQRPQLNLPMRQGIGKALGDAEEAWRNLRDLECGQLALIERQLPKALYEARLICRIRRNLERMEALDLHYGDVK